ncbi:MAG: hypothetical protein ABIR26_07715 [Ramlibacter sp.]
MSEASDKLALTRRAIIEQIQSREPPSRDREAARERVRKDTSPRGAAGSAQKPGARLRGRFAGFQRALGAWWRHHPAHMGIEIATPLLSSYAARRPVLYLGCAAGLGALAMVIRPWRLVSATGLVVALLKSSQLSSMVMSALSAADYGSDRPPYT